ncbi:hypothetical protein EI94DRAFT_204139 [Lactarius quietus]|nr:hypothetical protein EI94DRAFT_204139 [Lactarius quietus]
MHASPGAEGGWIGREDREGLIRVSCGLAFSLSSSEQNCGCPDEKKIYENRDRDEVEPVEHGLDAFIPNKRSARGDASAVRVSSNFTEPISITDAAGINFSKSSFGKGVRTGMGRCRQLRRELGETRSKKTISDVGRGLGRRREAEREGAWAVGMI